MNATSAQATSLDATDARVNRDAEFDESEVQRAIEQANSEGKTVIVENKAAEKIVAEVKRLFPEITKLDPSGKVAPKDLVHKVNEIIDALNQLSVQQEVPARNGATRDRGPVSEKQMTESDARRILLGDLSAASHKDAAKQLGLSYGQVYSARKGFTFKEIVKEAKAAGKSW